MENKEVGRFSRLTIKEIWFLISGLSLRQLELLKEGKSEDTITNELIAKVQICHNLQDELYKAMQESKEESVYNIS